MIKIKNYLEKLDKDIRIYNINDLLKEIHNKEKDLKRLFKNNFHISTYYNWVSGKTAISLHELLKLRDIDQEVLEKVYDKDIEYSVGKKRCILPKIFDTKLAYLTGVLHGDGSLHPNGKYITVTTESLDYLNHVILPIISSLFNIKGRVFRIKNVDCHRLELGSKVVHSFFSIFCPIGRKKGRLQIPKIISQNEQLLTSYLSGLFDTDGCLTHMEKDRKSIYFVFVQADKNFVFEVFKSLKRLGLTVNEPRLCLAAPSPKKGIKEIEEWRIYIGRRKDLYNFLEKIKFLHPMKKLRSELIVNKIMGLERLERSTLVQ